MPALLATTAIAVRAHFPPPFARLWALAVRVGTEEGNCLTDIGLQYTYHPIDRDGRDAGDLRPNSADPRASCEGRLLDRILRAGDVLVVTKLDRLARSVADLVAIMMRLKTSGAALKVLDSPIDMTSPSGELILHVLGAVARFERGIMLARQREGIAAAKTEGKYKGQQTDGAGANGRNSPPENRGEAE